AAGRLLGREDVLELLEADRRAMAEGNVPLAHLVGQLLQPGQVLGRQDAGVVVERLAGGVIVVGVIHPPGDRGVVVAQDGEGRLVADHVTAIVGAGAVADGVADAHVAVDLLPFERLVHGGERLVIGVNVGEDAVAHGTAGRPGVANFTPVTGGSPNREMVAPPRNPTYQVGIRSFSSSGSASTSSASAASRRSASSSSSAGPDRSTLSRRSGDEPGRMASSASKKRR